MSKIGDRLGVPWLNQTCEVELFDLEQANETLLRLKRSEINGAGVLVIDS